MIRIDTLLATLIKFINSAILYDDVYLAVCAKEWINQAFLLFSLGTP
jgi:hypothetical protein